MTPGASFPADQDLPPDAVSVASVILPRHGDAEQLAIVHGLKQEYALRAPAAAPCELIVMAVPARRGVPFLEGLQLALKQNGQLLEP